MKAACIGCKRDRDICDLTFVNVEAGLHWCCYECEDELIAREYERQMKMVA